MRTNISFVGLSGRKHEALRLERLAASSIRHAGARPKFRAEYLLRLLGNMRK
jgi:hypothetical protein